MFFINGGRGEHFLIQMENGGIYVQVSTEAGQEVYEVNYPNDVRNLCDGEWHSVRVVFNLQEILVKVDDDSDWTRSRKSEQPSTLRTPGTPTLGGIKPGSDSAKYISDNNLLRATTCKFSAINY